MRPRRIARPFTGTYIQTQQSEERSGKQKQKQQQQQHDDGSLAADVRRKPRFTVLSASTRLIRFSCRQPPSRKAGSALRGNVNTHTYTPTRTKKQKEPGGREKRYNAIGRNTKQQRKRASAKCSRSGLALLCLFFFCCCYSVDICSSRWPAWARRHRRFHPFAASAML